MRTYLCDMCGHYGISFSRFWSHMMMHKNEGAAFGCVDCSYRSDRKGHVSRHMWNIHKIHIESDVVIRHWRVLSATASV